MDAAGRWLINTLDTTGNPLATRMVHTLEGAQPTRLELADIILEKWRAGRTVLIGDAAAGFLPTAGIGASMAMESAAVLADELGRADASTIEQAVDRYITRRQQRVAKAHAESRRLATLMGLSGPAARIRDLAVRRMPGRWLIRSTLNLMDQPL